MSQNYPYFLKSLVRPSVTTMMEKVTPTSTRQESIEVEVGKVKDSQQQEAANMEA